MELGIEYGGTEIEFIKEELVKKIPKLSISGFQFFPKLLHFVIPC